MAKAYIIFGETGSWDDRREWIVAVYLDKEEAEKHRDVVQKWANEQMKDGVNTYLVGNCPYDANFSMDRHTNYSITEKDISEKFEQ